uniref:BMP6_SUBDO n=1 Tax=Suberites domuncula TaxID=55567 RepID=A0A374XXM1_SUBDO|nr:BMP6_SUBDO [Suberites domuncula]
MDQNSRYTFILAAIVSLSSILCTTAAPIRRQTETIDTVPQFLIDVYECWSNGKRDCLPETDPEVNVVRSLIGQFEEKPLKEVDNDELIKSVSVKFTHEALTKDATSQEVLYNAQLRVYKIALSQEEIDSLQSDCSNLTNLQLELYSVDSTTNPEEEIVVLEKSIPVSISSLAEEMWLSFTNVTNIYQSKLNVSGFTLRLAMGGACSVIAPSKFGITVVKPGYQPELIGYAKGSVEEKMFADVQKHHRQKRQQALENGSGDVTDNEKYKLANCQIYDFNVSFADIGWDRYIIRPYSYRANFCAGRCDWPLDASHNTTKHSYIQSIANIRNPDLVPPPCCSPTPQELQSLPVVVREAGNNFSTRLWTEMIATSCACL